MCLKINWSVKTSWHRPSMGVTRSWLWAPALLYYMYPIHACRTFLVIINHQHHETKPNWIFRLELSVVIPRLENSEECKWWWRWYFGQKRKEKERKLTLFTFKVRQKKSVKNFRYQFYFSHLSWNHQETVTFIVMNSPYERQVFVFVNIFDC